MRGLAAPEAGDPPEARDVDQPQRRVDHDGAERGPREPRQQRAARDQHRRPGRTTATSECSCVRLPWASPIAVRLPLLLTGNPRSTPAARLAAPRASSSVVPSMFSPRRVREGAGGEHVVGVADDRDADGREQQRDEVVDGQGRQPRHGQPAHGGADQPDPAVVEGEQGDDGGGGQHPDHRHRPGRPQPRAHDHAASRGSASATVGRCASPSPVRNDATSAGRVAVHGDAGDRLELADDHDDGDAGHVADEHGAREQVGQRPARSSPPSRQIVPTTSASPAASAACRAGSPRASGATAVAVSSAVVDSGPTDSWRDDPSNA